MGIQALYGRAREAFGLPNYAHYMVNDVDPAVNRKAIANIKAARVALDVPIDAHLRRAYERDMLTTLPGVSFPEPLFSDICARAIKVLSDEALSPCCYFHGDQAERQGIPKELIKRPMRCYTTDIESIAPDLPELIDEPMQRAIRSCIGSHFDLYAVHWTRNYDVPLDVSSKYDILSDRWHFDHKYNDIFDIFITLSHVENADGPTHIISAPDSRTMLEKGFDCALRDKDPNGGLPASELENAPSLSLCAGPPGTIAMSHTSMCLHKAGLPEPGRIRDIMSFSFRHSTKMDVSWDAVRRHQA